MNIHIDWKAGVKPKKAFRMNGPEDFGIYQIYGNHPVYGHQVLLYIGKAQERTFGVRLREHERWMQHLDRNSLRIYTGRISASSPDTSDWSRMIDIAERLLIFSHQPGCNASSISSISDVPLETRIYNWLQHGSLLPEVSALRYLADDETFDNYRLLTAAD